MEGPKEILIVVHIEPILPNTYGKVGILRLRLGMLRERRFWDEGDMGVYMGEA